MTYSRKSYWMFRGAMLAIVAAWVAFVSLVHPSRSVVPYVAGVVMIACCGLTIRGFLYLDEVQQARRMRNCFYGGLLGTFAACMVLLCITLQPSLLDMLVDLFHRHTPHKPLEYVVLGMMVMMIAQVVCTLLTSMVLRLKSGA